MNQLKNTNSHLVELSPQTLYRGLFARVARRLSVDASYVSRVARGERRSPQIVDALGEELAKIAKKLKLTSVDENAKSQRNGPKKRLASLLAKEQNSLRREWLEYVQQDSNLKRIELSRSQRMAPLLPLVKEALRSMPCSIGEVSARPLTAAKQHGKMRRRQGYGPTTLLEEYNLVRRCIYKLAERNLEHLEGRTLIQDLGQVGEVLDLQSQSAIKGFLGQA
jgi:hypothetical protein